MIETYAFTPETLATAQARTERKTIIIRGAELLVLTGDDCQEPETTPREITTEEFRDRFTASELLAVVSSSDAAIKYALLKLSTKANPVINLDNPEVIAIVGRLVTLGLLSAGRTSEILA